MSIKQCGHESSSFGSLLVATTLAFATGVAADSDLDCAINEAFADIETPNLSVAQRAIVADALHFNRNAPHPTCSFELDATLDYIPSRIERYDPDSENDSPWSLISVEDREPKDRERNQVPRYTRMSPTEVWDDLRENTKWDSLSVGSESEEQLTLIGLKNLKVSEDEFVEGDVNVVIDKTTRSLQEVKIAMKGRHKINFFATIAGMTMTQFYRYDEAMSRSILDQISVDWKFRFFFAPASSSEHITYRDYDCSPSSLTVSCEE